MTTQTFRIYENLSVGTYVDLIYDDVVLSCTSANVHVSANTSNALISILIFGGQTATQTFQPGTDTVVPFPVPFPVTIGTDKRGSETINFGGLESVSFRDSTGE